MSDTIAFAAIVLAAVALGALIALAGVHLARRNQSELGRESLQEIMVQDKLGYYPSHWPMTNGHHDPEDLEEVE